MCLTTIGDGIAVYGPVGPNQTSSYVVQIDGTQLSTFDAQKQFYRSQQIMFFASSLGGGSHTLTMRLGGSGLGELAIDYVNVYTAPSLGGRFVFLSLNLQIPLIVSIKASFRTYHLRGPQFQLLRRRPAITQRQQAHAGFRIRQKILLGY